MPKKLKQGVTMDAQGNVAIDTSKANVSQETIDKLKQSGRAVSVSSTPTPPINHEKTSTPTPPVLVGEQKQQVNPSFTPEKPREYISPRLQAKIDAKNASSLAGGMPSAQGSEQIAKNIVDEATKQEIKPVETSIANPKVSTQAEPTKTTPEVQQDVPVDTEGQKKYNESKNNQILSEFDTLLQNNPSDPKIQDIIKNNPTLRDTLRAKALGFVKQQRVGRLVNSLAIKTADDLSEAVDSGTILPGTEDWDTLSKMNPQIIKDYNTKKKNATQVALINGKYEVNPFDPQKQSGLLLQNISDTYNNQDSLAVFEQFMSSPEITNASTQISTVDQELITVGEQIQGIDDTVRKELPAGVPESIISGEIANRQKGLYQKATALEARKQALIENYNRLAEQAKTKFGIYQQDQQNKMNFMLKVYDTTKAEEVRYEDMVRQDELYQKSIERADYEYDRAIKRGDFEYARQLDDSRKQLQEDRAYNERIAMENALVNLGVDPRGMDTNTMYSTLASAVRAKNDSASQGTWKYDKDTDSWINETTMQKVPATPETGADFDENEIVNYSVNKRGRTTLQCGELGNDYWEKMTGKTAGLGNTYADKEKAIQNIGQANGPVVGGLFAFPVNTFAGNTGHTGVVKAINEDGSIVVLEANRVENSKNGGEPRYGTYSADQVKNMIFSVAPGKEKDITTSEIPSSDIALFNSSKYNPQTDKNKERVKRYEQYQNARALLESSDSPDILELMRVSEGQKALDQSSSKAYKDMNLVVSQLGSLKSAIDKYNEDKWFGDYLSPISGWISSKNPWDTKAQEIKSRLQAVVPKIARGIFGEVGVLTDQDIANYIQTLPNIKQTADVQDVVQLALLGTLKNALDSAVMVDSGTYNISGIAPSYKQITSKIKALEDKIVDKQSSGLSQDDEAQALSIK